MKITTSIFKNENFKILYIISKANMYSNYMKLQENRIEKRKCLIFHFKVKKIKHKISI